MKRVQEVFAAHLRQNGLRFTSERRNLLEVILEMRSHFSPDDVLHQLRLKKVGVSRATVYRLLPVLVEAEIIQQSLLSDTQTHFEVTWNKAHHDHLICSNCSRVVEFQHNTIELLQREIANRYGFILEHHVMELMGRCRDCRKAS